MERVQFGDLRIASLLFADDVFLLNPSERELQHAPGRFAAECETAGMRVTTSEAVVLCRNHGLTSVGLRVSCCPKMFKYLRVLFMCEGKMKRDNDMTYCCSVSSKVDIVLDCCGKGGAELQGKDFQSV